MEANTVSAWKKIKPHSHPPKNQKKTHLRTCDTYNIWHKVWTYTSATSFQKLTFLLAFIPSLRATQLIDGVMKKRLTPCSSTKDSVNIFFSMKKTIQKQLTLESCHIPIPVFWHYTLSASGINKKSFKHQCPECITESSLLSNFFAGARWGSTACQPRALSAGKSTQHEKTSHLCLYDLHCINILKKSQDSQPVEGVWKGVFHTNESASTVDVGDRIWYGFWVLHEHFGQWLLECVVRLGQHQLHDSSLSLNLQLATSVLPTCKTRVSKTSWTHFRIQNLSGNYWFEPQEMVSNIQAGHAAKYFQTTNAISVEGTYPWAAGRIKNASTFGMNFALVEAPVTVTDAWPMKGILEGEIYREKRVKSKQQTD